MAKILITGGAGMVGSHLVRRLENEHSITVLDNEKAYPFDQKRFFGLSSSKEVKFVKGDIRDRKIVRSLMRKMDYVIHAAAFADVGASIKHYDKDFENNVIGTEILLEEAKRANIKKFVFISSASVYGNSTTKRFEEDQSLRPTTTYANSKLWGEQQCQIFYELYGLPACAIRFFSVYGEGQISKKGSHSWAIPIFTFRAIKKKPLIIFGDGKQIRDMTHIDDFTEGVIRATFSEKTNGRIFNIGTGKATTVLEMAKEIQKYYPETDIEFAPPKKGDPKGGCADKELMKELLGWEPKIKFEDGVKRYVEWVKKNPQIIPRWV